MGKGTDKLYITHSEWSSDTAFGASKGSSGPKTNILGANFRRLPFNFCAVSLQPFRTPVCTSSGIIFDHENILEWLKKHGTNPVDGTPLKSSDLIALNFMKNDDGEFVDPVTYRGLTDNSHIVALKNTGNVFTWDTIHRLNIKAKNWKDLVSEEDFSRKDIITLQDPQSLASRDLSSFKYVQEGVSTLTPAQEAEQSSSVNSSTLGSSAKLLKAKEAVAKARADREKKASSTTTALSNTKASTSTPRTSSIQPPKKQAYNAALHTTGRAAASFTSTNLTPHTTADRATLTDEQYMLVPKRITQLGYARVDTTHGSLTLELHPLFAPRAVWNFVTLAKRGYYNGCIFHRSVRNFMLQGGDPTGTGREGESCWGKPFADELEGPRRHDARGVLSMANKGKDTNTSQFFVTYRAAPHLDRKHTVFGKVVGGLEVLDKIERVSTDEKDRPEEEVRMREVVVYVDPFEEFLKARKENKKVEEEKEVIRKAGGTEDERVTWTGKRVRGDGTVESGGGEEKSVGRYLKAAQEKGVVEDEIVGDWEGDVEEPVKKKVKAGGFGNFDAW